MRPSGKGLGIAIAAAFLASGLFVGAGVDPAQASPAGWTDWIVSASGGPGDWSFFYKELVERKSVNLCVLPNFVLNVEAAESGPTRLFLVDPSTALPQASGAAGVAPSDGGAVIMDRLHIEERDGPIHITEGHIGYCHQGTSAGIYFGLAANAPWTMEMRIRINRPVQQDHFESHGSGATFVSGEPSLLLPAGIQDLATTVPSAGWTHFDVRSEQYQPNSARVFDVWLPNGYVVQQPGVIAGGMAGYGASVSSYWLGGVGSQKDIAGDFSSRLTYIELTESLRLSLVHLPMEDSDFPPGWERLNYNVWGQFGTQY